MSAEAAVRTVDGRDVVWEPQPRQDIALRCPALELCYGGSKGGGKDCHVASKVPTPDGWTTIGDIRVGDTVFAADGTPTGVVYVSPVYTNKRCYELTFSDGTTVVCSEDHPWSVKTNEIRRAEERLTPEWRVGALRERSAELGSVRTWQQGTHLASRPSFRRRKPSHWKPGKSSRTSTS